MTLIYRTKGGRKEDRTVELALLLCDPKAFPLRIGESEKHFVGFIADKRIVFSQRVGHGDGSAPAYQTA